MKNLKYIVTFYVVVSSINIGCKKFIEAKLPVDQISGPFVFQSKQSAVLALTGIYAGMAGAGANPSFNDFAVGERGISIKAGLWADELIHSSPFQEDYVNRFEDNTGVGIWTDCYKSIIYNANSVIDGTSRSNALTDADKSILIGEAKFIRAMAYFYLVNFFGDIPLVLTTDLQSNSSIARTSTNQVYDQIILDLKDAQGNLKDSYLSSDLYTQTNERVRPNRFTATALLSRVYLFKKEWRNALDESAKIINNLTAYGLTDLNEVFVKNSREAIWQLQTNALGLDGLNTPDGRVFLDVASQHSLSEFLLSKFEPNDKRRSNWVTSMNGQYVPFKYKKGRKTDSDPQLQSEEYTMVFRLSEQYLIRSEAEAQLGLLSDSRADLNVIRERAGLQAVTTNIQSEILDAILRERQVELFTEWGHRWLDLKRTEKLDEVMSVLTPKKGGTWNSYKALLPIPYDEIKLNPLLRGHQNPGYPEQR
ncbi:RagB/SusD family nutrient uptake outer membrane protein [Pedobacter sp. JY14-1]|uniref:RagB/SusD family nutrient uptake outer membrane protein n=1 Tax=Pedobacter sp. JY14-1 TaxID=3034151 RepID=UPI0023E3055E|nr:RagB/SusD family nutrient uptake outer membrane protein [Pedobacter sp. JY14-1]